MATTPNVDIQWFLDARDSRMKAAQASTDHDERLWLWAQACAFGSVVERLEGRIDVEVPPSNSRICPMTDDGVHRHWVYDQTALPRLQCHEGFICGACGASCGHLSDSDFWPLTLVYHEWTKKALEHYRKLLKEPEKCNTWEVLQALRFRDEVAASDVPPDVLVAFKTIDKKLYKDAERIVSALEKTDVWPKVLEARKNLNRSSRDCRWWWLDGGSRWWADARIRTVLV